MTPAEELLHRGMARHREGRLAEAASLYRRALRLSPGHPDAENLLGVLARQQGDLPAALAHAARAVAAVPDSPLFLANHRRTYPNNHQKYWVHNNLLHSV